MVIKLENCFNQGAPAIRLTASHGYGKTDLENRFVTPADVRRLHEGVHEAIGDTPILALLEGVLEKHARAIEDMQQRIARDTIALARSLEDA